jgi:hypothetical protein
MWPERWAFLLAPSRGLATNLMISIGSSKEPVGWRIVRFLVFNKTPDVVGEKPAGYHCCWLCVYKKSTNPHSEKEG